LTSDIKTCHLYDKYYLNHTKFLTFRNTVIFLYAHLQTGPIMWLGMTGRCPHRFPHNNFSYVYQIFTKLDHMIPLWKGKNPIYVWVIRSKVKVSYYEYNFWQQGRFCTITLVLYIGSLTNLTTWFTCGRGRPLFILGSKVKVTITINRIFDNRIVSTR
jgi:hypothetical protein